ncbi:MAG: hypothetical protein ACRDS0_28835 [Pseudonocardiaceae bacterium]
MPSSHRPTGVVALLALGVALGGCGSADVKVKPPVPPGVSPQAWIGAFCGGLGEVIAAQAAAAKPAPTPQGQKDGLLKLADATVQALTNTAHKLTQLGPPGITNGKQTQDSTVGFFTTAAAAVDDRRVKLAELDVKDPNFAQKANQLAQVAGTDLGPATTQVQGLTSNKELTPAFGSAPECQRLGAAVPHQ